MKRIDYKWVMLALVSSAYFLAQGTRQIYNSVLPQIKEDFLVYGVTDTQLGLFKTTLSRTYLKSKVTESGTFGEGHEWKLTELELTDAEKAELDANFEAMNRFLGR